MGAAAARPRVLVLTNLFPVPWETTRGTFNAQQFTWLAERADVTVAIALPLREALRRPRMTWRTLRLRSDERPARCGFLYLNLPRPLARLNALLYMVAFCLQHPRLALWRSWDCLVGSWLYPDAVAAAMLAAIRARPIVPIALGTDGNVLSRMPDRRPQIAWMLRRARRLVTVSAALREVLADCGATPERTIVAYTGVDPGRFRPMSRASARAGLGIEAGARVVLFVGNLIPTKGTRELLAAAVSLLRSDPRWMFVLIGGGPEVEVIRGGFEDAGAAHRVMLPGRIPNTALATWYASADVVCLPSHREGVPNVVLEAMACGRPVVATRVGGIPEVVPEFAGILVEPHSSVAVADALRRCLETTWDESRIAASAGRFSWATNVDQLLEAISAAAAPGRDGGTP